MALHVGMLWFDDAPDRPLALKISRAARHYELKYGRPPNICYLNLNTPGCEQANPEGLRIYPAPDIMPHHFWLGVVDD